MKVSAPDQDSTVTIDVDVSTECEVEYIFRQGRMGGFNTRLQQHYPDDPPDVTIKGVYMTIGDQRINILTALSRYQIDKIKYQIFEREGLEGMILL